MSAEVTRHRLPDNDAWISRFKDLQAFHDEHGRLPSHSSAGGPQDTLRRWLERQRALARQGALRPSLARILETVPGALASAGPVLGTYSPPGPRPRTRLDRLEEFHSRHGRLPRFKGTEEDEAALYQFVIDLRTSHRRGELSPGVLTRLGRMPDLFHPVNRTGPRPKVPAAPTPKALRMRKALEKRSELVSFCVGHGRPPAGSRSARERSLYSHLYKVVRPAYASGVLDPETRRRLEPIPGVLRMSGDRSG